MKVSQETAKSIVHYLDTLGLTPAQAAHDCSITLRSIEPYTDRRTERLRDAIRRLDSLSPEKLEAWKVGIRQIAAGTFKKNGGE